ncbi:helix-turn-helix domain-containing protein, partial [Klebsiella michiganensis]|uniref:helix-turn-helix domain-containing protein n=1 Tax=Klebsiella michiganensis TaxID=1134687 RepID=UPI0021BD7E9C
QTETEATGAPQKHHYTLNQQVGSITKKSGKLISKYEIMKHLHDDVFNQNNNTVEVLIGRLRKKIAPYKCARIENKRGDGYYLDAKNIIDH